MLRGEKFDIWLLNLAERDNAAQMLIDFESEMTQILTEWRYQVELNIIKFISILNVW